MSPSTVTLQALERDQQNAYFPFSCSADLEPLLWGTRVLQLYCSEGVASDPAQLTAAFCVAMAPLSWMYGTQLRLPFPILDRVRRSLRSLGEFLAPHYAWPPVDVTTNVRGVSDARPPGLHSGLLFSGGVDSSAALVALQGRADWLIHVSNFENLESRMSAAHRTGELIGTRAVADDFGLGWMHLRSNIPEIFKHNRLDEHFPPNCSFWLGLEHVQHLATVLTAMRPRLRRVYIAGGFSELTRSTGSCAASAEFVHRYATPAPLRMIDEKTSRQRKVERILNQAPQLLRSLRMCYSSGGAPTCIDCLKCQATALMVLSGGGDLESTAISQEVLPRLLSKVDELSQIGPAGHAFFNEALTGRLLHGPRRRRWQDLRAIIVEHLAAVGEGAESRDGRSARTTAGVPLPLPGRTGQAP